MNTIRDWLKGKKSYIVAAGIFIVGGLRASGVEIPEWIFGALAAAGLAAIRAGIQKAKS